MPDEDSVEVPVSEGAAASDEMVVVQALSRNPIAAIRPMKTGCIFAFMISPYSSRMV